jgi:CheY-like chemotaxis protein
MAVRKRVVALLSDLMFTVKIQDAAKRADVEAVFVKTRADAVAQAKLHPELLVLDLNYAGGQPLPLITELKKDEETSGVPLLGYVSHVETELIQDARTRGCDRILARSAFSQDFASILTALAKE